MIKRNIFLILILGVAFFVRVFKLGEVPVSLYMDEASVGYDAFSLWNSGMDQWGQTWPFIFKSFGEYKYPWHVYAALISGVLMGWSEFSIRFPSACIGTLNVLEVYLIAKLVSGKKSIGLFAAMFLAISPWHVQFTRMAWESAYVLGFLYLGVLLIVKGIKSKSIWLFFGAFFLGLAMFAYNSAKIVVPIFVIWTGILYWNELVKKRVWYVISICVVGLFLILGATNKNLSGVVRYDQVGVREEVVRNSELFKLTSNYRIGLVSVWIEQYLQHFAPKFMILSGDLNPRHSTQFVGELLLLEFVGVFWGLVRLVKYREKWLLWVVGWILIAPLPAAITMESPHALRAILGLGAWQIVASAGFVMLFGMFEKSKFLYPLKLVVMVLVLINAGYFLYAYFVRYPVIYSNDWQYGYSQIFQRPGEYSGYDGVVVTDRYAHPYIFMAWKYKMSYREFHQNLVYNDNAHQITSLVSKMGKVYFRPIDLSTLPKGRLLIYAHPSEKLSGLMEKNVLVNPDGTIAFYVYEYENKN